VTERASRGRAGSKEGLREGVVVKDDEHCLAGDDWASVGEEAGVKYSCGGLGGLGGAVCVNPPGHGCLDCQER
jgi:hypothetical protein